MSTHATTTEPVMAAATSTDASAMVRCADCLHCKVFKKHARSGRYVLLLRCSKGKWLKGGTQPTELTPPLHMLMRRLMKSCLYYESLSEDADDRERYLAELEEDLPCEQYVYEPDGAFVDMTEVPTWHPNV